MKALVILGVSSAKINFFMPYIGFDYRYRAGSNTEKNIFGQSNDTDKTRVATLGFHYTLPDTCRYHLIMTTIWGLGYV